MEKERSPAISHRLTRLAQKMGEPDYRHSYVEARTRQFLARQMRAFRGNRKQKEFGETIGQSQSIVSQRLENPAYGKWTAQTLFEIARKLNVAVLIRFVDFETFLKITDDDSEATARPKEYDQASINKLAEAAEAYAKLMDAYLALLTEAQKAGPRAKSPPEPVPPSAPMPPELDQSPTPPAQSKKPDVPSTTKQPTRLVPPSLNQARPDPRRWMAGAA